jgi:hypothetical protein
MPHFGNLYGLTRYVDKSLNHEDYIVFESGTPTDAIKLSYQGYERNRKAADRRPGNKNCILSNEHKKKSRNWAIAIHV